jgi:hypothetical protein
MPLVTQTVDIWRQRSTSPPFGQQDSSPNFNYFTPSIPQTPTSIKTGLTLDPYFSHEGFQSYTLNFTLFETDVTTWQEQGSSTILVYQDYQQHFISHC